MNRIEFLRGTLPVICFHRGYSSIAPENTLSAFRKAVVHSAKMIEIDVQLTKDGEVVVIHDFDISRVSNGRGKIADLTLDELKTLDFGKWYSIQYYEERIPTLDEVFDLLKNDIFFDIEIKVHKNENPYHLVEKVINLIYEHELKEKVFLSSFKWDVMNLIRKIDLSLITATITDNIFTRQRALKFIIKNDVEGAVFNYKLISERLIEKYHDEKKFVFAYTVNDEDKIKGLSAMGIDGIITDGPEF